MIAATADSASCNGDPRAARVCSHPAHLWATSDSAPHSDAVGTPQGGGGYVATWPTSGPPLIVPPALKWWGPLKAAGVM